MLVVLENGLMLRSIGIDVQTTYEGVCRIHLTDEQCKELNVIGFVYEKLENVLMVIPMGGQS